MEIQKVSSLSSQEIQFFNEHLKTLDKDDILQKMLDTGYDPRITTNAGNNIIHAAAKKNDLETIFYAIAYGVDLQKPNKKGDTPLHIAAENGHLGACQLLIEHGADFGWENELLQTPFHLALKKNQIEVADFFVDRGYKPKDTLTDTLIAQGYHPNLIDNAGNTPLHKAVIDGNEELVLLLLKNNNNVNDKNKSGTTPLMQASQKGNSKIVEILLFHNADINAKNNKGDTALHIACKNFQSIVVSQLLSQPSANPNQLNTDGIAPIHYACGIGSTLITKLLIEHQADVNLQTNPQYWSPPDPTNNWSIYDWDAYGEAPCSAPSPWEDQKPSGYLAPKISPLSIVEKMHPNNTFLKDLLEKNGAKSHYESPILHSKSKSLTDYLK